MKIDTNAIEEEKKAALAESNKTYSKLSNDNERLYKQQNQYADQTEKIQNNILDRGTAHQTEYLEKQKGIAKDNMHTETKKAKNDYSSYVNPYGYQAEELASRGLANSGVSETAKLGSYNMYQNRVAAANKTMQEAITQYDQEISDAMMQNSIQKAQNALNKLQMKMQFSETYYNNNATIAQNRLANQQSLNSEYNSRNQFATEFNYGVDRDRTLDEQWLKEFNANEEQRKIQNNQWKSEFNWGKYTWKEGMKYQKGRAAKEDEKWEKDHNEKVRQNNINNEHWEKDHNETVRQNNINNEHNKKALNHSIKMDNENLAIAKKKLNNSSSSGGRSSSRGRKSGSSSKKSSTTLTNGSSSAPTYSKTGFSVDINGTNTPLLISNGKYYYSDGNGGYIDITGMIANVSTDGRFITTTDGQIITKG